MKFTWILAFALLSLASVAQDKYDYTHFNNLIDVEGTSYVIASANQWGKSVSISKDRYLLFVDSETGETNKVEFPEGSYLGKTEQIKIDELDINLIVVVAQTVDLDGKKGIGWNDPKQLIILSADGKTMTQLTDERLFVNTWTVNKKTGNIVVTGHFDRNNNGKYDKKDQAEIGIYSLKTLNQISKF